MQFDLCLSCRIKRNAITQHTLKRSLLQEIRGTPAAFLSALAILALTGYYFWFFQFRYDRGTEKIVSMILAIWLSLSISFLAFRLAQGPCRSLRKTWLLLALAGLANAAGEAIWFYYESIAKIKPFLSTADFFSLCYYPLMVAAVLSLPFGRVKREERVILWLDVAIVLTTSFMMLWYFILLTSAEYGLKTVVTIYYPLGGLLFLAALVALMERKVEGLDWWTLFLIGSAMIAGVIADSFFAYFEISELHYDPVRLNFLYLFSLVLMMCGIAWQSVHAQLPTTPPVQTKSKSPHVQRLALPYLATIIGLTLLVLSMQPEAASPGERNGILWGTITLVGLVLVRQYVVLRENVQLTTDMQRLATTDSLTGVYNRRFANDRLRSEIERAERYGHPLSVLLMDIDGFKRYNDTFGHLSGDTALLMVTESITELLRSTDLLARFGGDEFLAILPETEVQGARVVAHKMKRSIAALYVDGTMLGLSVGVATFSAGVTAEQLLEDADRDLYRQKKRAKTQPV